MINIGEDIGNTISAVGATIGNIGNDLQEEDEAVVMQDDVNLTGFDQIMALKQRFRNNTVAAKSLKS